MPVINTEDPVVKNVDPRKINYTSNSLYEDMGNTSERLRHWLLVLIGLCL